MVEVPFGVHHPVWVEDPDFDLDYHVRRAALPAPGGLDELAELTAEIAGRPLDRRRPLWELWVVEGLEHGYVGVIAKMHHAAIDGVLGVDLMTEIFDLECHPEPKPPPDHEPTPERVPSDSHSPGPAPPSPSRFSTHSTYAALPPHRYCSHSVMWCTRRPCAVA